MANAGEFKGTVDLNMKKIIKGAIALIVIVLIASGYMLFRPKMSV
ncbi:MAG: hypothetical protein U5N56_03290 [Candidatus Marinimicrobia bacterium]|nr:hypothetical protein [Candidatus Neomarinimicrobiota bacterium]